MSGEDMRKGARKGRGCVYWQRDEGDRGGGREEKKIRG